MSAKSMLIKQMKNPKDEKENNKLELTIYSIIVLSIIFAELLSYFKSKVYDIDYYSSAIGFVAWFGFFFHSQKIINKNQFKKFAFIGLLIFMLSIIKQLLTSYHKFPLMIAGFPLLYIGYFRLLTFLFHKEYPKSEKKLIIVYASKFGTAEYEGKERNYIPSMKEKLFSLLLFMGFMGFAFGIAMLLKNITSN
jgi:hypothetical protein